METKTQRTPKDSRDFSNTTGFDVTCVIGRVEFDANGDMPPHVAAMRMIAEHDSQGTYTFPMRDGRTCVVVVEYENA